MSDYVAPTLMSLAARVVHRQPFVNLIVTNVPGPQLPLYMMGARLLEAFPIVPLTRNLTVVVGILSYDGTLHFGLWADRDACARPRGAGRRDRRRVRGAGEGRTTERGTDDRAVGTRRVGARRRRPRRAS